MKRFIILISLIPQLIFAQYQSREFMLPNERNTTGQAFGITTTKDSIVALNISQPVSGLFISGITILNNMQDSYARVTVKDRNNAEYLVYEIYPLLSDSSCSRFSKVAMESILLDNIVPSNIRIEVNNASIQIDSIYFSIAQNLRQGFKSRMQYIRQEQTQHIAEKLNEHLMERQMTWIAGPTSIASATFEERKKMFGTMVPCLHGFDFYKDGIYIVNPTQTKTKNVIPILTRDNTFVKDYDWRYRHGKNWITSVKYQNYNEVLDDTLFYSTCWAHASTATIESNFNIYFNKIFPDSINNLSEQELVSCLDNDGQTIIMRLDSGGRVKCALDYVQRKGIVRNSCFPFGGNVSCNNKCNNPEETISFFSFQNIYNPYELFDPELFPYSYTEIVEDTLKKAVIKSPVVVDLFGFLFAHSVSCVGFHQIQMGDTIYAENSFLYFHSIVDSLTTSYLIDQTSWIIKNSWGTDWGKNGFGKVLFSDFRLRLYEIIPPFSSLIYSDNDRCVTDEDMDGYYTWGSGSQPSNLPVWIPDEQDGDDTSPDVGPIDEYGNCDTLTVTPAVTWYIDSTVNHSVSDNFTYPNIVILQGGVLTIDDSTVAMKRNAVIRVQSGGKLIIDGGQIRDADIVIEDGGTLIINNGGLVKLRHNGQCLTQVGAKVLINNGKIE